MCEKHSDPFVDESHPISDTTREHVKVFTDNTLKFFSRCQLAATEFLEALSQKGTYTLVKPVYIDEDGDVCFCFPNASVFVNPRSSNTSKTHYACNIHTGELRDVWNATEEDIPTEVLAKILDKFHPIKAAPDSHVVGF